MSTATAPAPAAATDQDIAVLARRYAELAASPENQHRIAAWKAHNDLKPGRPLIHFFPEGSWGEISEAAGYRRAADPQAEWVNWWLWHQLYAWDHFAHDAPLQPWMPAYRSIGNTGWGITEEWTHSSEAGGARAFKPVIHGLADLDRLRQPDATEDVAASARHLARCRALAAGALPVHQIGIQRVSFHLWNQFTAWRGLEQAMEDLVTQPELLERGLGFLAEGHRRLLGQLIERGLLTANADSAYQGSGGLGWSDELPGGPQTGTPATMWAAAESQELSACGPRHHRDFALRFEGPLVAPFARAAYGCCEPLHRKLPDVFAAMPNLRRVSISPWAEIETSARHLAGRRAIFSWKPNPARICGQMDETVIRGEIHQTVAACKTHDCTLEIILKDTHTCDRQPEDREGLGVRSSGRPVVRSSQGSCRAGFSPSGRPHSAGVCHLTQS